MRIIKDKFSFLISGRRSYIDLILLTSTTLIADLLDKRVELSSLPRPVQEAIKQHSQGGNIKSIEEESSKKDGLKVYEVEVKNSAGKEIEFKVDETGKLLNLKKIKST